MDHRIEGVRTGNLTYEFSIDSEIYEDYVDLNYTIYLNDSRGQESLTYDGSFIVEEDKNILLSGFLLMLAFLFFVLGRKKDIFIFEIFSGFLFVIVALGLANIGIPSFSNDFIDTSSIIIFASIGFYIIINSVIKVIK